MPAQTDEFPLINHRQQYSSSRRVVSKLIDVREISGSLMTREGSHYLAAAS